MSLQVCSLGTFLCIWVIVCLSGTVFCAAKPLKNKDNEPIVVHVIAHSHDDVGWLKTVDQYYYGANNTIQNAGVQYILDNVVKELAADPAKRFIYVEIAYFERWWNEQSDTTKTIVRNLVAEGRLEFVNGGWCMNDEATTHYEAIIDQMTAGHQFLLREFGIKPTIGWHIDPFGHASTQASLFAQMGFNGFFFARIDYQDKQQRIADRELEFIWRGSQSLGSQVDMFTHVLWAHYSPPDGFCFECPNIDPIMDDPRLEGLNVASRALALISQAQQRSAVYRTNQILMTFGDDFQYMNADINFKNIDKLMKYVNANPQYGVKMIYSTPSVYVKAVHHVSLAQNITWSLKTDDFFPYADEPHAYWTGFYTSRPALKSYIRTLENFMRASEQLYSLSLGIMDDANMTSSQLQLETLSYALAIAQHHDAISGTEKQHVANDYAKLLSIGSQSCQQMMQDRIAKLLTIPNLEAHVLESVSDDKTKLSSLPSLFNAPAPALSYCAQLNQSVCDPLTKALAAGRIVPMVITNPLAWQRTEYFRLPVPTGKYTVVADDNQVIPSQLLNNTDQAGLLTLLFAASVPPLGYRSVVIQPVTSTEENEIRPSSSFSFAMKRTVEKATINITSLSNRFFSVAINHTTNGISSITNKLSSQMLQVQQGLLFYYSNTGDQVSGQPSGAYIFRPQGPLPQGLTNGNIPSLSVLGNGSLCQEVMMNWTAWAYQKVRVYNNAPFVEIEYNVGPIDVSFPVGKEVFTKFQTNMTTNQTWYTDSEGQEMQQRRYNYRPTWTLNVNEPVAGNYFPLNTAAYIQNTTNDIRFAVTSDRSQGVSSLADGELEVMLHRRLMVDDNRGVNEALNEDTAIRAIHRLFVGPSYDTAQFQRQSALLLNNPCLLWFAGQFDQGSFVRCNISLEKKEVGQTSFLD
ncbi:carbohydrate binding [Balamuthia mandrillaris]